MIIKSMSRKVPTFGQLADYIARGSDPRTGTVFVRNLYASGQDTHAVAGQFLDNYRYLPERKNGNALYHEVIVLEPQAHLPQDQVEAALCDLAEQYCQRRAPHQLAWGRVHHDTDFPHIHLMISANAVRSDRRVRLDRKGFAKVQQDLEAWRDAQYPELNGQVIYRRSAEKETPKVTRVEGEMVRRAKEPSAKQKTFNRLAPILKQAAGRSDLDRQLMIEGYALYQRGQTWGVIDRSTGRRYRLKTLGLHQAFKQALGRNSVPSQTIPTSLPRKASTGDARADALLRGRRELDAQARDLLDDFGRDEDDGR